jgi:hypothetical protein
MTVKKRYARIKIYEVNNRDGNSTVTYLITADGRARKSGATQSRRLNRREIPYINLIKVEPFLDPLRGDPRFDKLVSRILSGSVK